MLRAQSAIGQALESDFAGTSSGLWHLELSPKRPKLNYYTVGIKLPYTEFGAVLEGFLFSTYAGVYKSMLFWPHPLIKSLC